MKPSRVEMIGRAIAASILSAVLGGCGDRVTTPPPRPATLAMISGNNQSGTVGEPLPSPLVVRVNDQNGRPMGGATVTWTVASGGGSVDHSSSVTGTDGTASARWTLGPQAGTNTLTAAAGALPPVTFTATGTVSNLASITIAPPGTPLETGDLLQLSAAAADADGNPLPLPSLVWTSSDAGIARVTADGFLVALGPGDVSVSAASGKVVGTLPLTIDAGITFSFGPEETVFTWLTDQCEALDVPDAPAHAVRLADNSLVLIAGDAPRYYNSFGADFSSLKRDCAHPALVSDDNAFPESYDNYEWLTSAYRQGNVIHALIHNEYHDPFAANCSPGNSAPGNPCWYNSVTYASSTDGGHTFAHATPPSHAVAPPWLKWDPQSTSTSTPPPYGYFNPANIVQGQDSFYYSIFVSIDRSSFPGLCLMRTQTLGDPASWRAWDGTGFNLQMTSPYAGPAPARCATVENPSDLMSEPTLTYNTYLGKYMIVGTTRVGGPSEFVCGSGYSLSSDLINWGPRRLLRTAYLTESSPCPPPGGETGIAYPSVIDHNDSAVNFERPGRTPYLYFTRFNDSGLNRDLVRAPVTITAH